MSSLCSEMAESCVDMSCYCGGGAAVEEEEEEGMI